MCDDEEVASDAPPPGGTFQTSTTESRSMEVKQRLYILILWNQTTFFQIVKQHCFPCKCQSIIFHLFLRRERSELNTFPIEIWLSKIKIIPSSLALLVFPLCSSNFKTILHEIRFISIEKINLLPRHVVFYHFLSIKCKSKNWFFTSHTFFPFFCGHFLSF